MWCVCMCVVLYLCVWCVGLFGGDGGGRGSIRLVFFLIWVTHDSMWWCMFIQSAFLFWCSSSKHMLYSNRNRAPNTVSLASTQNNTINVMNNIKHLCCVVLVTGQFGIVFPLQDVALHQSPLLSSVQCCPAPDSYLLYDIILPSSAWSSSGSFPSPWLHSVHCLVHLGLGHIF